METFQIRIHREWNDVSGIMVSYLDKSYKGFAFQHNADEDVSRTHTHTYHFQSATKKCSVTDFFAKKLGMKGNKDFGSSHTCGKKDKRPLDISGAWCYGSKWGTIAPSFLKNISPVEVEQLQVYAKSMATVGSIASNTINTVVIKEIKVKSKPTQYEHAKTCATRIMENHPEVLLDIPESRESNMRKIFEMSYAYFRESGLYMGKYKQLDFMDMVLTIVNSADYHNQLLNAFYKRHEISRYNV